MISFYRVFLAIHLIAVISWMAGILYLYRLFVYHAEETENVVKERFQVMERKLLMVILLPAMIVSLFAGLAMLHFNPELLKQPWMHVKLLSVAGLMYLSHIAGKFRRQLAENSCPVSGKQFRFLNEAPTLLMIVIIFMVILRPF